MSAYTPEVPNARRTRIQIILLALLFGLPFVGSYVAFYLMPEFTPKGRLNYGTLVQPTRSLPVIALRDEHGRLTAQDLLRGKWTLVQIVTGNCDENCLRQVVLTRQTRQAMNRDEPRIRRVLLATPEVDLPALKARFGAEQPDLHYLQDALSPPQALPEFAGMAPNSLMLVDPLGNWMMSYGPAASAEQVQKDFKGLQKDLRKLLKLSHID